MCQETRRVEHKVRGTWGLALCRRSSAKNTDTVLLSRRQKNSCDQMSHPSHWSQQAGYDAFPKESIGLSACFPQSAAFGGIFFLLCITSTLLPMSRKRKHCCCWLKRLHLELICILLFYNRQQYISPAFRGYQMLVKIMYFATFYLRVLIFLMCIRNI